MTLVEKLEMIAEENKKLEHKEKIKPKFVQFRNPLNKKWMKLDTDTGRIVAQTKSEKPFKGIMNGKEYLKNRKH